MELVRGRVVRSLAGHDRGTFFVVLEEAENGSAALLCDGKRRPLERPKRKKRIHLALTATVVPDSAMNTNREIQRTLRAFAQQGKD